MNRIRRLRRTEEAAQPAIPASAYTVDKPSLRRWLPSDPVILEAGAHVGMDTVELAKTWPGSRVFAFEPVPEVHAQLAKRVRRLSNVVVDSRALGAQTGTTPMYVSGGASDGSSSLRPPKEHLDQHPQVTFARTIEVSLVSVEDWVREQGIDRIDFMWLDMQGHEFATLQAVPDALLDTVSVIVLEIAFKELYEGAPLWDEVRPWLEARGFTVETELAPWEDGGNAVVVRSR
jgi:FkbM family methyltransferase